MPILKDEKVNLYLINRTGAESINIFAKQEIGNVKCEYPLLSDLAILCKM